MPVIDDPSRVAAGPRVRRRVGVADDLLDAVLRAVRRERQLASQEEEVES